MDALTVFFTMEPKLVHSKFLLSESNCSKEYSAIIEDEVRACIEQAIVDDKKKDSIILKYTNSFADMGSIRPVICHLLSPITKRKRKLLRKESYPKILQFSGDYIVCANTEAFDWLSSFLNLKNEITIVNRQYIRVGVISSFRFSKPFSTIMEN